MGFFDGLDAEKYDRTYADRDLFKRIVGYFKPQWKRLSGVALLTLAIAGSGSLLPIIVSRGATTTLAVETAEKTGLTVVGFARSSKMVVYTHPRRIEGAGMATGTSAPK